MNEAQQNLADKIGELLAESLMDDELKNLLLDNMEKIPENLLFKLKDALEMDQEEMDNATFEIELFLKGQDENWKKVAEEQKKTADAIANAWVEKLK